MPWVTWVFRLENWFFLLHVLVSLAGVTFFYSVDDVVGNPRLVD